MTDNDDKIQQFITVTGAEADRATFFLESSNWDIDSAVSRFLDGDMPPEDDDIQTIEDSPPPQPPLSTAAGTGGSQSIKAKPKPRTKANSRFGTLKTLDTSSDDDEEDGQAFYAGGSEHSGQQVLGPSKKKKDFVADIFKSVKDNGVEVVDSDVAGGPSSGNRFFRGTGYKLGASDNDTEVVGGPESSTGRPAVTEVSMKLWREGFSVDDGPFRSYSDPANRDFMESVRRGEIPMELRQGATEINLSMEDHRGEAYKGPAGGKGVKAFTGTGHTLGNPTPPTVGAPDVVDQPINEAHAREVIALDPEQPTTNLQIRLADGTRLLGEFNHEHTVAQVRLYILAARPQYETRPFSLLSTFPSRVLEETQTIKDAGILNSAIMQKLN